MTQSQWGDETIQRIAKTIRLARGDRSVQWVADRTAELGHPLSRSAISNLEVGRKSGVDITELIVLARALEVAPLMLLYPDLMDGPVEITPGQVVTTLHAHKWFAGEWVPNPEPLPSKPEPGDEDSRLPEHENWRYLNAVQPVDLARGYIDQQHRLRSLLRLAEKSEEDFSDLVADYQDRIAKLKNRMADLDMVISDE